MDNNSNIIIVTAKLNSGKTINCAVGAKESIGSTVTVHYSNIPGIINSGEIVGRLIGRNGGNV